MTEPYGQDLRNRHEHREEGHASQQATKQCVRVAGMTVGVVGFGNIVASAIFWPEPINI